MEATDKMNNRPKIEFSIEDGKVIFTMANEFVPVEDIPPMLTHYFECMDKIKELESELSAQKGANDIIAKAALELEKELALSESWVKHHQNSVEIAVKDRHAANEKIEELKATIKELNQWYEEEHDKRCEFENKLAESLDAFQTINAENTRRGHSLENAKEYIPRLEGLVSDQKEKLRVAVETFEEMKKLSRKGGMFYDLADECLLKIKNVSEL